MYFGKHVPVWLDTASETNFSSVIDGTEIDVAIIGGGIAGLSIGTLLKMEGLNVAVIELNRIGHYISGTTTAKISCTSSLIYNHIISKFGKNVALKFKEAYFSGFSKFSEIVNKLDIDCDYRKVPFYIFSDLSFEIIEKEIEALKKLNIDAKLVKNVPYPFNHVKQALLYENQGEFHPKKYLNALAEYVNDNGSFVFEKSKVIAIEKNGINLIHNTKLNNTNYKDISDFNAHDNNFNNLKTKQKDIENFNTAHSNVNSENDRLNNDENSLKTIITNKGNIKAKNIVIATNSPIYDPDCLYEHMTQNKSYVLGFYGRKKVFNGLFVNINPFHSLRLTPTEKGELMILAGEHHPVGEPENTWDFYKKMRDFADDLVDVESFEYFWTGGDNITEDRLPFIGETSQKGIYIATGFNSWGMNSGTLSGIIIRDLILKKENNYSEIFSPLRFKNKNSKGDSDSSNFKKINHEKIAKFKKLPEVHWNKLGENLINLKNNEAKLVEFENNTLAIYKDNDSNIFPLIGKCTHNGCNLRWNTAEKVWECPCHGSIFDYKGNVIRGPAIDDLRLFN